MVSHVVILFSASFICGHRCLHGEESGKAPPAGAEEEEAEGEAPGRIAPRVPLLPPVAQLARELPEKVHLPRMKTTAASETEGAPDVWPLHFQMSFFGLEKGAAEEVPHSCQSMGAVS